MTAAQERLHARALLLLLEQKDPCGRCPYNYVEWELLYCPDGALCITCGSFLNTGLTRTGYPECPCHYWGHEEAIKRTWLKLEELGYLD